MLVDPKDMMNLAKKDSFVQQYACAYSSMPLCVCFSVYILCCTFIVVLSAGMSHASMVMSAWVIVLGVYMWIRMYGISKSTMRNVTFTVSSKTSDSNDDVDLIGFSHGNSSEHNDE